MENNRKSLSLKWPRGIPEKENVKRQKENADRFSFDIDADNLSKYKEGVCLLNTEKNTEWAFKTLKHGGLLETRNTLTNSVVQVL